MQDYLNQTTTCQYETKGDCLTNLKKYHSLMQLPFKIWKLGRPWGQGYWGLGFGTYLAYFSRLLANPSWNMMNGNNFLMNKYNDDVFVTLHKDGFCFAA